MVTQPTMEADPTAVRTREGSPDSLTLTFCGLCVFALIMMKAWRQFVREVVEW